MAALGRKHLAPLLALGIVYGDPALAPFNEDNKCNDGNRQKGNGQQHQDIDITLTGGLESPHDCTWKTCDNT